MAETGRFDFRRPVLRNEAQQATLGEEMRQNADIASRLGRFRIARVFVWNDDRPDDHDEIRSVDIAPYVTHSGTLFAFRTWDIRYPPAQERITDAFYDEVTP
jgi:hypothetical protein